MPLKVVRRPGCTNLYVRGTVSGQPVFESTRTARPEIAEQYRIKREGEISQRRIFGAKATATFVEAAVLYMEAGGERRFLSPLVDEIGAMPLKDIGQGTAEALARALYPGASAATLNRQLFTPLSAVINTAARSGLCEPVRFKRPKMKSRRRPAAEPEQLQAFMAVAPIRIAALAQFMALTGRRVGEALRVAWEDLDLQRGEAWIRRTKNGDPFLAYLPSELVATLANLPRTHPRLVFGYESRYSVYKVWRETCRKAGIPYLTPHEMGRHTFATWMRRYAGLDLPALMEAGGWKSAQMVMRYAKVTPSEIQRAADRLPGAKSVQGAGK